MTHFRFDVRISIPERTPRDRAGRPAVGEVLRSAAAVLALREYGSGANRTLVTAEWPLEKDPARDDLRLAVAVNGDVGESEALTCAQLFCHDIFICFNLAAPGELTVVIPGANEHVLDACVFDYARAAAQRNQWPAAAIPALHDVVAWYDALTLSPDRPPSGPATVAIIVLLQLARDCEWNERAILWLSAALDALFEDEPSHGTDQLTEEARAVIRSIQEERRALADGNIRITHPMHDFAQNPQDEEHEIRLLDLLDLAASQVIAALHVDVVQRSGRAAPAPED